MHAGQQFEKYFCSKCQDKLPYLHCQAKCHFDKKKSNYVLCGNMNVDVSPYVSKFKFFFKNACFTMTAWIHVSLLQSKIEMIYFRKMLAIETQHRNATHILDMSCCYQHQRQKYHNENDKICMFIHYMYVDILFPLTKVIPIMFEHVTTHYQTLEIWIGHNAMCYRNFNVFPHALPYIFSQFNMVWGYLQRVTKHYRRIYKKVYTNIFFKK